MRELADRRLAIDDIGVRRPTLDEVFLTLTGRPADAPTPPDHARRTTSDHTTRSDPTIRNGATMSVDHLPGPAPRVRTGDTDRTSPPSPRRPAGRPRSPPRRPSPAARCASSGARPQLIVVGALTSAMFLLIFRYVFGGAIDTGSVAYADYLIPAMAVGTGLFASGAVGVADDIESGLFDRLRSLPIPRSATLLGRSLADTVLVAWGAIDHGRPRVRHRLPLPRRRAVDGARRVRPRASCSAPRSRGR